MCEWEENQLGAAAGSSDGVRRTPQRCRRLHGQSHAVFVDVYPLVRYDVPLRKIVELKGRTPDKWEYRANFTTRYYLFLYNFVQVMADVSSAKSESSSRRASDEFVLVMKSALRRARAHLQAVGEGVRGVLQRSRDPGRRGWPARSQRHVKPSCFLVNEPASE